MPDKLLKQYKLTSDKVTVDVKIVEVEGDYVRGYFLDIPEYGSGTEAMLDSLRKSILTDVSIKTEKMLDPKFIQSLKEQFRERAMKILEKELPNVDISTKQSLIGILIHEMLGLGKIEFLLADGFLEEIVINTAKEPVWIYHKEFGWLKTNIIITPETEIQNYASIIARRVGKQITILSPLLDAHLITGDRANATLFPISGKGNTVTIRRFRREPWTVTDFIENKTTNIDIMALIWIAMQYELNIILSGGTASGKTSMLNVCVPFIQPNHRIISIEDSVLPESEILCEKNGKIIKTTVGSLIDEAIGCDELEDICIDNIPGLKIFSMNKDGRMELKEPSKLIRHKVRKKVVDILTESGRKISVTADHSLFSLNEVGKIFPISGTKLKKGMFIATPRILCYETKPVIFDLSDKLYLFEGCFVKSAQIASIVQEPRQRLLEEMHTTTINRWIREGTASTKVFGITEERCEEGVVKSKYDSFLPLKIEVDEDLACLIGLWLADGCYDKNSILISVVEPECREIVERVAVKYKTNVKMHSDGITLMLNSKPLRIFFEEILGLHGSSYTKRFPKWVFGLPRKEMAALLRGYFSGDGWVRKYDVALRCASLEMLKDLQTALLRFGVLLRLKRKRLKDKTFEARISGSKFLSKFKQISFLQQKKQKAVEVIANREVHDVSDIIPLPKKFYYSIKKVLKKDVGKKYTYKSWKSWTGNYLRQNSNMGRNLLKKIVVEHPEIERKETLEKLVFNEIIWDKIREVREREFEGFVYDFSVPENESFICENIVCHNTRELNLPSFLHWVPMTTREPNPEGKGGVGMLDLLVNSLRMRPDRIIVGEIRRQREAEVMFEAMHTGHSVYTTFHANTADETIRRFTNPPVDIPPTLLEAVHLNIVMFRNRRLGVRRILELAEFIPEKRGTEMAIKSNIIYRWKPSTDSIEKHSESIRFFDELSLHTGLTADEIGKELKNKQKILEWMVKNNIRKIEDVGNVMAKYYMDPDEILGIVKKGKRPGWLQTKVQVVK